MTSWLNSGGRRLDAADSYDTQYSVGVAIARSLVPRSSLFVLQKTGNWNPMGYNDTRAYATQLLVGGARHSHHHRAAAPSNLPPLCSVAV